MIGTNQSLILKTRLIILMFISALSSTTANFQTCATLRSKTSPFENAALDLKDGSVLGNTSEEFLSKDNSWNVTATWTVSPSCELTSCSDVYLSGNCVTFSDGATSSSSIWLSAQCRCNTECSCPSDFIKRSACARAYLNPGSCNSCDASYTELDPVSVVAFPDVWKDKVSNLVVRTGCNLSIYEEEDHEGDSENFSGPFLSNWNREVGSYECECNDANYPPTALTSQAPPSSSPKVDIPNTLDDVITKLSENNFNHLGLLAALSSLTHGRSSKNVYMLLIGSSGAGKSSTINILLGKPNMTMAGDHISTTSEIIEFKIPIPVPELDIANAELRIIDTPGLGDTRGLQNDALFLATLDDYLSNHEELKTKIPNLVLIFHTLDDNRFHGEGAKFVRMIRGLDSIRPRITDENYSNVLFVFSHLCSVNKHQQQNPIPRLMMFKEVVELYSFFPKPILTAVVENKGMENELFMKNGNFELPNKELYPQNLLDKFDTITLRGGDKIGNAVINTNVIRNQSIKVDFDATATIYPLVNSNHNKVSKYLNILSSAAYNVNNSEVSNLLAEAYNSMDPSIKTKFPQSLENLQRYLNLKDIKSKTDVPQTSKSILELLFGIEQSEADIFLLETGLNMKAPVFATNTMAGYSYDIRKNSHLSVSPFKLESRRPSVIGYMLPNIIRCKKSDAVVQKPLDTFMVFDSKQKYFDYISKSLLGNDLASVANSTEIFSSLTNKLTDGYFAKDTPCSDASNMNCFTVTRFYKTFEFDLEAPISSSTQLQSDFVGRVQTLTAFNESSHDSVEQWATFFKDFGTHVVKSANGGGRIDLNFKLSNDIPIESAVKKVLKSLDFAEDPLGSVSTYKENSKAVFAQSESISHTLTFRGGNQEYHVSDISKLSLEDATKIIKNWKSSLKFNPVVFPHEILPIGQVVESYFPVSQQADVREKIETAFSRLLTSTLKYVEPTPDPKILEELERKRKENEERLKQLELEQKKKAEEAEKLRLAEIEAKRRREQEEFERNERLRKEAEAAAQRRIQEELQRKAQEAAEAARRLQERLIAEYKHRQYMRQLEEENRQRQEYLRWLQRERERQWEEEERRRRSSCLKKGTKIMLADFTEKPVELLKIGDALLDKDLKPTHVLGISFEFLLSQQFYGFDNKTFFFTDTHLFAGPGDDGGDDSLQFYTTSTVHLFQQNPLIQYLNVKQFRNTSGENANILYYDKEINAKPVEKDVTIFKDENVYPVEMPIYFIQVDSPSGTYFAEGFLCRHEIPPLHYWPNTMPILFSLFGTSGFEKIGKMPYSIETISFIDHLSDNLQKAVMKALDKEFLNSDDATAHPMFEQTRINEGCSKQNINEFDLDSIISRIFGNPTMATLGMEIYGGSGNIISKYIDSSIIKLSNCRVRHVQTVLFDIINKEIELRYQDKHIKML